MTKYMLHFLDGAELLQMYQTQSALTGEDDPEITAVIQTTEFFQRKALLHQILNVLKLPEEPEDCLRDKLIFIAFPKNNLDQYKSVFEEILNKGLKLQLCDLQNNPIGEKARFVPFEKSSSQTKKCVMSFIREDLFEVLRQAIDLDLDLEKIDGLNPDYLSRLYSYRGLYLSDAAPIAYCREDDEVFFDFFRENRIVVVDEIVIKNMMATAYTADADEHNKLTPKEIRDFVKIKCFDGEGILSPDIVKELNERLGSKKDEPEHVSFQVRMPFFKGMLHCVNFHDFFKEVGLDESAEITDAFGRTRKLFEAKAIVPTSMFKLHALRFHERLKASSEWNGTDPMQYYFDKMRKYEYGLYVEKTNYSFQNDGLSHLTYQYLSTLDLTDEDFNSIVQEHVDYANAFTVENLQKPQQNPTIQQAIESDLYARLLKAEPLFAQDHIIRKRLKDKRVSLYKDIAFGRLAINGETRLLSGDLLYFLYRLADNAIGTADIPDEEKDEKCEKLKKRVKNKCIGRGKVYLPGTDTTTETKRAVALFRSPHLSRNEDVYATVFNSGHWYRKYLSHLKGVAMVGHRSHMPAALGGADFDGDIVHVIFDERVVKACRSGYWENGPSGEGLPFINIPSLKKGASIKEGTDYAYVYPPTVFDSFNARIGLISNAALRLAAVEYAGTTPPQENLSAALCTIMTGNEIDSAKSGVKPYINDALAFKGDDSAQSAIVKEVDKFLDAKTVLKELKARVPKVAYAKDGAIVFTEKSKIKQTLDKVYPNKNLPVLCRLLYCWASLLANAPTDTPKTQEAMAQEETSVAPKAAECPAEVIDILKQYQAALDTYTTLYKLRSAMMNTTHADRIKTILKLQYDDIYYAKNGLSPNKKFFALAQAIADSGIGDEDIEQWQQEWFREEDNAINFETFWPFSPTSSRDDMLGKFLASGEDTDIVTNFDAKGYYLLYYMLDHVQETLQAQKSMQEGTQKLSQPTSDYDRLASRYLTQNLPLDVFKEKLAEKARRDIRRVFEAFDILSIYRSVRHGKLRHTFWTVYSISKVLKMLEEKTDD